LDFFSRRQNNENNPRPDDESPLEFCLAFLLSSKEKMFVKLYIFHHSFFANIHLLRNKAL